MTKEKIIDCITKNKSCSYVATGADLKPIESTRLYQFGMVEIKATADELIVLIEQEKTNLLKEFVEYLKSTKKYQAIDEDIDLMGISRGKRYMSANHQLNQDLEKFLEERK